jgi:CBS domain-containing protein
LANNMRGTPIGENDHLIGIVTDRDIVCNVSPQLRLVSNEDRTRVERTCGAAMTRLGGLRCSANGDELTRELLLISAPKPTPGHDRNGGAARPDAGVQYTSTGVSRT